MRTRSTALLGAGYAAVGTIRPGADENDNHYGVAPQLTWRIHRQHAVALKYQFSRRDSEMPSLGERTQTRGTLGIFYTLLGHDRFGMSDWR